MMADDRNQPAIALGNADSVQSLDDQTLAAYIASGEKAAADINAVLALHATETRRKAVREQMRVALRDWLRARGETVKEHALWSDVRRWLQQHGESATPLEIWTAVGRLAQRHGKHAQRPASASALRARLKLHGKSLCVRSETDALELVRMPRRGGGEARARALINKRHRGLFGPLVNAAIAEFFPKENRTARAVQLHREHGFAIKALARHFGLNVRDLRRAVRKAEDQSAAEQWARLHDVHAERFPKFEYVQDVSAVAATKPPRGGD